MAHSWIEAFDTEEEAFESYQKAFPETTVLLIDTYDTVAGARKAVVFGKGINGVRLDSGDLHTLSKKVRKILDRSGLKKVKVLASGNLNEYKIAELVAKKAPIDSFGVGTDMVVSRDMPALDLTYKLVQIIDEKGQVKFKAKKSKGKKTIPGRKQVFRKYTKQGAYVSDTLGLASEPAPRGTRPLLEPVIRNGKLVKKLPSIDRIRDRAKQAIRTLPRDYRNLKGRMSAKVDLTARLQQAKNELNV